MKYGRELTSLHFIDGVFAGCLHFYKLIRNDAKKTTTNNNKKIDEKNPTNYTKLTNAQM